MKLLELPLEISQYILEKVVFSYDNVADNVKFRLVCSNMPDPELYGSVKPC